MQTSRTVYGDDNLGTLNYANNLAVLLMIRGNPVAAEPLLHQTLARKLKKLGPEDLSTLVTSTRWPPPWRPQ